MKNSSRQGNVMSSSRVLFGRINRVFDPRSGESGIFTESGEWESGRVVTESGEWESHRKFSGVICAPAAFLGCGSRFSGFLSGIEP